MSQEQQVMSDALAELIGGQSIYSGALGADETDYTVNQAALESAKQQEISDIMAWLRANQDIPVSQDVGGDAGIIAPLQSATPVDIGTLAKVAEYGEDPLGALSAEGAQTTVEDLLSPVLPKTGKLW